MLLGDRAYRVSTALQQQDDGTLSSQLARNLFIFRFRACLTQLACCSRLSPNSLCSPLILILAYLKISSLVYVTALPVDASQRPLACHPIHGLKLRPES